MATHLEGYTESVACSHNRGINGGYKAMRLGRSQWIG
ncbi:hypothetical protein LINGRAHAP2_LOCUS14448 [Linum grandiflorum]